MRWPFQWKDDDDRRRKLAFFWALVAAGSGPAWHTANASTSDVAVTSVKYRFIGFDPQPSGFVARWAFLYWAIGPS